MTLAFRNVLPGMCSTRMITVAGELGDYRGARDGEDGGHDADLGDVHLEGRVRHHHRRSVCQTIARQVVARIPTQRHHNLHTLTSLRALCTV